MQLDTLLGPVWMPANCQIITPQVAQSGMWEPEESYTMQALLRPGDTLLDIGSHAGWFTVLGALQVGSAGRVIAIEADPRNHALVSRNIADRGFEHAVAHHTAAGAERTTVTMRMSERNTGGNYAFEFGAEGAETFDVVCQPLDDLLGDVVVDVVKLDVEGFEPAVIQGMAGLLQRSKPRILMEYAPILLRGAGHDPAQVLRDLRELGFDYRVLGAFDTSSNIDPDTLAAQADARPEKLVSLLITASR